MPINLIPKCVGIKIKRLYSRLVRQSNVKRLHVHFRAILRSDDVLAADTRRSACLLRRTFLDDLIVAVIQHLFGCRCLLIRCQCHSHEFHRLHRLQRTRFASLHHCCCRCHRRRRTIASFCAIFLITTRRTTM